MAFYRNGFPGPKGYTAPQNKNNQEF